MSSEVKNIIESSNAILITRKENENEAEYLASLALYNFFVSLNKPVLLWPKEGGDFYKKFENITGTPSAGQTPAGKLKICVPKQGLSGRLTYDEEDEFAVITLNSENNLNPEDIKIDKLPPEVDVVFSFGDILGEVEKEFKIPDEKNIVKIDNSGEHFSVKLYDLITDINDSVCSEQLSTLVFAVLAFETNYFRNSSEKVFELAKNLLGRGARQETVKAIFSEKNPFILSQLAGRALARTALDQALGASWTFISQREFQKTNTSPDKKNIKKIWEKIYKEIEPVDFSVICWQTNSEHDPKNSVINAMIFSDNPKNIEKVNTQTPGATERNSIFLENTFSAFSDAEIKLKKMLRELLQKPVL